MTVENCETFLSACKGCKRLNNALSVSRQEKMVSKTTIKTLLKYKVFFAFF